MNFEMSLNEYTNNDDDDMDGNMNGMDENILLKFDFFANYLV